MTAKPARNIADDQSITGVDLMIDGERIGMKIWLGSFGKGT